MILLNINTIWALKNMILVSEIVPHNWPKPKAQAYSRVPLSQTAGK